MFEPSTLTPEAHRLLAFARELQRASTFGELLEITRTEVLGTLGYAHTWFFVADTEGAKEWRLLDVASAKRDELWAVAPSLRVRGDAMLEEIANSDRPVVIADARIDPRTNKDIVAQLGNRTIINVPLRLLDVPFGAFGTGTFGDEEGVRPPTPEQLDYLVGMAGQLAVAAGRIRFLEERKDAGARLRKTEDDLRQAQKMEAIGQLAGGVAHDFNNLLTVVLSCSGILLDDLDPSDRRREEVLQIQHAGQRASELTHQLLAFGRRQVLEPRVLDLRDVIGGLERLLRRTLPVNITLHDFHPQTLSRVKADPGQMEQILVNLAVNARDAMPSGGKLTLETANVTLDEAYVSGHADARPGRHVMLAVSDTGTGMDRATQERIFDPFFTTKSLGHGTGLGLATVYGIVKQSGGSIWVYSEVGQGTTFKIYLPVTDESPAPLPPPPTPKRGVSGSETVLLVEDEEAVRTVLCTILRRGGYTVLEAATAAAAVEFCRRAQRIDLLLTDVVMPGIGGRELSQVVQSLRPGLPVLFMSGYTDNAIVHHGMLDPGVRLLEKPITPDALALKVREVLDSVPGIR